jgi:glycine/D-amino acid oxidase-like deaminating enzyme
MRQCSRGAGNSLAWQLARRGIGRVTLLERSVAAASARASNTIARDVVASRMHHDARPLRPATAVGSLAEKGRICMPS